MRLIPSLKNLLRPVNRLPPEIISDIIQYIPEEYERDASSIIPMTHVCRYWRESIISSPENWTRISSQRIGLAKLSLERCKAASLQLWLEARKGGVAPRFSHLIKPYVQNTKVLGVDPGVEKLFQTLRNFLPLMPNLRSLSIFGGVGSGLLDWFKDPCGQLTLPLTYLLSSDIPLYPSFLRLRTLTDLTFYHSRFSLQLDTLLEFLEENRSLERATLDVEFTRPSLRFSRRQAPIQNRLQNLSISSSSPMDVNALISKIAVQKGAHLEVLFKEVAESKHIRSVVSTTHLLNLPSPTFIEYCPKKLIYRTIRLLGPNGSFSLKRWSGVEDLFVEFPLLPLDDIRTFYLRYSDRSYHIPTAFPPLAFPTLEVLAIERETDVSRLLSAVFSDPSSSPSLKTLAFLDCRLDEEFMVELTRFSSSRKNTTSARLHRVVIVHSRGQLPPFALIDELGRHVPVVDVRIGKALPSDLKWSGPVDWSDIY